jgi:hypothetical protein
MITEQKIKEVKKLLKKGVPAGELITDLKEQGFSEEEIQKVFYVRFTKDKSIGSDKNSFLSLASIGFMILGGTLLLGPPIWLRNYGYFYRRFDWCDR